MKTAMQELIEYLEIRDAMCKEAGLHSESGTIRMTIGDAKLLLEKEKEQIQNAFSDGQETPLNHPTLPHYSREEYYIDNYNQKELIIVDFDKVKEEWIEEANGMTDLEKAKYYLKKINQNK